MSGVPERGSKSRVETHIKASLQLEHPEAVQLPWKRLRLPTRLMAYDKFIKGSTEQELLDRSMLHLSATVVCPSRGNVPAVACFSCIQREYRRKHKKGATASPYPDLNSVHSVRGINIPHEQERILLFNNYQMLDFCAKTVQLTLRFTCYCRHHEETRGFKILFRLLDARGLLVAWCLSPPIMITDDRKPLVIDEKSILSSSSSTSGAAQKSLCTPPSLESIIPKEVSLNTETEAVIVGRNLTPSHTVLFGAIPARIVRLINSEAVIVKIPPSAVPKSVPVSLQDFEAANTLEFVYRQAPIDSSSVLSNENQDLICEPSIDHDMAVDALPPAFTPRSAAR